jgi:protein-disulfide isomerase
MTKSLKISSAIATVLFFTTLAGCAKAGPANAPANKAEIEDIVKAYILENPEIIREALVLLEEKEDRASIVRVAKELRHDARDYSIGPKNAKVTMVEFFDYNCTFCRKSTGWVQDIMAEYPNDVRIVFKELPILDRRTQTSRLASKAALAAHKQGKYQEMHFALMKANGLSKDVINTLAKDIGLDMGKFTTDLTDNDSIDQHIEDTIFLASQIPSLTGTPFFVVNDKFINGGNTPALQKMITEALAK